MIRKMILKAICALTVLILFIAPQNKIFAQDFDCCKELIGTVFDHSGNENDLSVNGYDTPEKEGSFLQTGSTVYFCSEADCSTITVVFSGQTLDNYLNSCSEGHGWRYKRIPFCV